MQCSRRQDFGRTSCRIVVGRYVLSLLLRNAKAYVRPVPGKRYALTLQLMLKRFKRRKTGSVSRSPQMARPGQPASRDASGHSQDVQMGHPMAHHSHHHQQPLSPTYDTTFTGQPGTMPMTPGVPQQHFGPYGAQIDTIWRGFESTSTEQLPVWLSDQTLGGASFSQNGIDAFLLPNDYLPPAPQIW